MTGEYERKLARILHDQQYAVMRAPSSGGGTKRDLPDLLYAKPGEKSVALELKTTSEDVAYYDQSEVRALDRFAEAFDARGRLCVRWKGDTRFYTLPPSAARRTDSGNYAVDRDSIGKIDSVKVITPA